jgi:hypothetical protein
MTSVVTVGSRRRSSSATGTARRFALCAPKAMTTISTMTGSTAMYTMHEALARERMRANQREAEQLRVAKELAAARRWHRLEVRARAASRRARAAELRHALRAI